MTPKKNCEKKMIDDQDAHRAICLAFTMQPVKFGCDHKFCLTCVKDLVKMDRKEIRCPLCRQKLNLDIRFVKSMVSNKN